MAYAQAYVFKGNTDFDIGFISLLFLVVNQYLFQLNEQAKG
tara:strand:+ start:358 stop:480 length:123 start_codon:yes stop_codon:yes gene_type:complete